MKFVNYTTLVKELMVTVELSATSADLQYTLDSVLNSTYSVAVMATLEGDITSFVLKLVRIDSDGSRLLSPTLEWSYDQTSYLANPFRDGGLNSISRLAEWLERFDVVSDNNDVVIDDSDVVIEE